MVHTSPLLVSNEHKPGRAAATESDSAARLDAASPAAQHVGRGACVSRLGWDQLRHVPMMPCRGLARNREGHPGRISGHSFRAPAAGFAYSAQVLRVSSWVRRIRCANS